MQAAQYTARRCSRWLEGERDELLEAPPARSQPRPTPPPPSHDDDAVDPRVSAQQSRCCALAADGELSRACAALTTPPLLPPSGGVMQKLREKHPRAGPARPALVPLGPPNIAAVPDITGEHIRRAIQTWSRSSAPGPTGLRGDHLREALGTAHADEVATHLCAVVQLLVRGEGPAELAPHIGGATLHALVKGADDVRPIAVGETLRRLTSKCLCAAFREPAREWLCPLQVGVAVPLGAEAAVHTARQWMQRRSGHATDVFLKVDFHNAFNTVDRAALLREVRLRLPGLAPWAEWCYGRHSRLLFHKEALTSEAGVQQGDPLGPLLFALALQPALRAASGSAEQCPSLLFGYLDDVCLAGDYRAVSAGLGRLVGAARQVGLTINPTKCEVILCGGADSAVDLRLFPAGIKVTSSGSFSLLGAPIGTAAYCEAHTIRERVETAHPLLQALAELPDPQTALLLLRHCAGYCKVVYTTRVTPPALLGTALDCFDAAVRQCLEAFCTGPLTPEAWLQASLSTTHGGLGLRHAQAHALAGHAASLAATQTLCTSLDPHYTPTTSAAIHTFNQQLHPSHSIPVPAPPDLRQQQLSRALDRSVVARLAMPDPGRGSLSCPPAAPPTTWRWRLAPRPTLGGIGAPCPTGPLQDHGPPPPPSGSWHPGHPMPLV